MIIAGFSMEIRLQKLVRYDPERGSTSDNFNFFLTSKHTLTRSVSVVTDDGLDDWGLILGRGKKFSFSPTCPDRPRGPSTSGVPRNFVRGGSTNSVEDRENGDLGAVAPLVRGSAQFANE
jgi:hypothetical protein